MRKSAEDGVEGCRAFSARLLQRLLAVLILSYPEQSPDFVEGAFAHILSGHLEAPQAISGLDACQTISGHLETSQIISGHLQASSGKLPIGQGCKLKLEVTNAWSPPRRGRGHGKMHVGPFQISMLNSLLPAGSSSKPAMLLGSPFTQPWGCWISQVKGLRR